MMPFGPVPVRPAGVRAVLWPLLLARHVWTGAVADDAAIRFNMHLLTVLTAVFSLPSLAQGLLLWAHATGGSGFYGAYVAGLAGLELSGAMALAGRHPAGRWPIMAAAGGFYLEAALGLAVFERGVFAVAVFIICAPAEAWVLWFLSHHRVRAYLDTWR